MEKNKINKYEETRIIGNVRRKMDKYKEQLGILIDLCEKQIRTIKVLSDYCLTDAHLMPQIVKINNAKEVYNNENEN
jgi:pyruvate kinase